MKAIDLKDLAKRCELLERPDRAIDWEVHCRHGIDGAGMYGDHPKFTESVDAALCLVPADHDWIIEHVNEGLTIHGRVFNSTGWGVNAATAITVAALRAQAEILT